MKAYSINLKERVDRMEHTKNEFSKFPEFKLNMIEAKKNTCGAIGLWDTIQLIVKDHSRLKESDFLIICEDDHVFTQFYSHKLLLKSIETANNYKADILLGGVSWTDMAVKVSQNMYWIKNFSGLQFLIIFKRFFQKILDVKDFNSRDTADKKMCELSENKFVIAPFISIQKEFGYSDATVLNNVDGRVSYLFERTSKTFDVLEKVNNYFNQFEI